MLYSFNVNSIYIPSSVLTITIGVYGKRGDRFFMNKISYKAQVGVKKLEQFFTKEQTQKQDSGTAQNGKEEEE